MSVVIAGVEMPKSCYYCPMTNDGFYLCKATSPFKELEDDCEECKPQWCPLIPAPPRYNYSPNCGADMRPSEEPKNLIYIPPEKRSEVDNV